MSATSASNLGPAVEAVSSPSVASVAAAGSPAVPPSGSSGTVAPASPQGSPIDPTVVASSKAHENLSPLQIASSAEPGVLKRPARLMKVLLAMRDEERKEQKLPPYHTPPETSYNFPSYVFVSARPPPPPQAQPSVPEQQDPIMHHNNYRDDERSHRDPIQREPTPALPKGGDVPPSHVHDSYSSVFNRIPNDIIHTSAAAGSYPPPQPTGVSLMVKEKDNVPREPVPDLAKPLEVEAEYSLIQKYALDPKDTRSQCFLISAVWWDKWLRYTQVKSVMEIPPAIDNTDLLETPDTLKKGLKSLKDFQELSETQWTNLQKWYSGGPAIARSRRCLPMPGSKAEPVLYPIKVLVTSASSVGNLLPETIDARWTVKQMRHMVSAHMSSPPHKSKLMHQSSKKPSNSPWQTLVDDQITLGELGVEEGDVFTASTSSDRNSEMVDFSRSALPEVKVHGPMQATHDDYPPPLLPNNLPSTVSTSSSYHGGGGGGGGGSYYQDDEAEIARVIALSLAEETERQMRMKREADAAQEKASANNPSATAASSTTSSTVAKDHTTIPDHQIPLQPRPIQPESHEFYDDSDDERTQFDDDEDFSYITRH